MRFLPRGRLAPASQTYRSSPANKKIRYFSVHVKAQGWLILTDALPRQCGRVLLPIKGFLGGRTFDAQAIDEMSFAFEGACDEPGLVQRARDPNRGRIVGTERKAPNRPIREADMG
jgi:hypothetical protein